jgi:hypothetical protein
MTAYLPVLNPTVFIIARIVLPIVILAIHFARFPAHRQRLIDSFRAVIREPDTSGVSLHGRVPQRQTNTQHGPDIDPRDHDLRLPMFNTPRREAAPSPRPMPDYYSRFEGLYHGLRRVTTAVLDDIRQTLDELVENSGIL